ncbi:MAG: hypothetical protein AB7O65_06050 [Candidatus Korobacteraceae bacterium]
MVWRALLPFLKPLVPVAVDYARTRMQNPQPAGQSAASTANPSLAAIESLEARLMDAEARTDALARFCQELGEQMSVLSAEANSRIRSARIWTLCLLAWNLALTAAVAILLLR